MKVLQKTKGFGMEELNAPTVHGETDIVLKNVKTGLVERYHDENTFQSSVLQMATKSYGQANTQWSHDYTTLVGGILLFRDQITVGKRYMPAGNVMNGRGYRGSTTQGTNPFLGTFNESESAATASAITQVWDYATNQGNGTTSCVCLTSIQGGLIGYGDDDFYLGQNDRYNLRDGQSGSLSNGKQCGYYGKYLYQYVSCENDILTISKTPVSIVTGSVFNGFSKNITFDLSQIGNTGNITPDGAWGDAGNGKFRFTATTGTVAAGGNLYYYEFDAANETLTECILVNSSGSALTISYYSTLFFANDIVIHGTGSGAYVFDAATSTLLDTITGLNDWRGYIDSNYSDKIPGEISDGLFLFDTSDPGVRIYDSVNHTLKPMPLLQTGSSGQTCGIGTRLASIDDGLLRCRMWYRDYGFKNPLYLATINNLSSAVTKTAAQTMKVTYTLTEV